MLFVTLLRVPRGAIYEDVNPSSVATTSVSAAFSMTAERRRAPSAASEFPRAAEWTRARTVSSRIPVRDDRRNNSSTQLAVAG